MNPGTHAMNAVKIVTHNMVINIMFFRPIASDKGPYNKREIANVKIVNDTDRLDIIGERWNSSVNTGSNGCGK
ncbi:hypothetical protein AMI01nite_23880 [Aneurinibacillus migulanus]|nr:hypothetical protein AMI01nite_23880 [Aneurinibacillus migulanus]